MKILNCLVRVLLVREVFILCMPQATNKLQRKFVLGGIIKQWTEAQPINWSMAKIAYLRTLTH